MIMKARKPQFKVLIITKRRVLSVCWCHYDYAKLFLQKYSNVDSEFIAGAVQSKLGRAYEVIYTLDKPYE